ncbi:PREDICTED: odorant receptor 13a-like isoform X1 [Polistes canadensis]|uniref:odorant receptor 13a-like isoform X1 n=1 Tax=Polistes canadensis TaxID=91411 RepID=UPI000718B449|nr:PREDICTED: odorant receptor 13a-like isoform X1 [Polistes canadensis]
MIIYEENKNYEEDLRYTNELCDYLLRTLGVWPFSKNTRNTIAKSIFKLIVILICYGLLCFFVIPAILHLIMIETNPHAKLKKLPLIFYNVMSVAKYSGLILQENQIARCLRHVEEDWKSIGIENYRTIMKEKAKIGRRLLFICGILMYSSGGFNRVFLPLSRGTIVTPQNITIRPLPCSAYYIFFDEQITPNYEIVFCLQCVSGLVTYSITTAICGLAALFVMHACGQLEILVDLIEGIVKQTDLEKERTNKLISITVEHQIRVRSFLQTVEVTMQQICLIELMGCTLTMCFFGYCLITEWGNHTITSICTYFVGLLSITSHIFMFCFVGEQLTLQAEKVALTSCILDWYRLPNDKAKSVILIMAISHCPMRITAGNVIELSLQTFGQVIKTAAAYCNMLRTVT